MEGLSYDEKTTDGKYTVFNGARFQYCKVLDGTRERVVHTHKHIYILYISNSIEATNKYEIGSKFTERITLINMCPMQMTLFISPFGNGPQILIRKGN